jgi:transketolase
MRKTCLETIYKIAQKDKKIIFIGSDLGPGVLDNFKKNMPDRFLMEGVSEQAIVGIAAGLAMEGYKPYVNTISTFITRRCFEQIAIDLCLHNLPVKLVGNGGGLVYAPLGPTHQAIEDLSIMRTLPNMSIISPCDAIEMEKLVVQTKNHPSPIYIRIARGGEKIVTKKKEKIQFGKGVLKIIPKDYLIISTGITTHIALEAASKLKKEKNITCGVIHIATVKPLDEQLLIKWISRVKKVITIEENVLSGGFGSSILELVNKKIKSHSHKISCIGLGDKYIEDYGTQDQLLQKHNLTAKNIIKKLEII